MSALITFGRFLIALIGYGASMLCLVLALTGVVYVACKKDRRPKLGDDIFLILLLLCAAFMAALVTVGTLQALGG